MNKTTLVLLPGLDGTGILFGPLIENLPSWICPVVVQYPAGGANSYEALLELVDGEVAALESFAILGCSFGGPLAVMIAARRPSQVSALVLCASFIAPPCPRVVPYRFLVRTPVIAVLRTVRRFRYWIPGFASNELRRAKAAIWEKVGAGVLATRSRAVLRVDARAQLRACRAPLLYLLFTQDEVVPRMSLDEVLAVAPHAQVDEVEGSHNGVFTNPVDSAACIAGFLSGKPVLARD